MSGSDRYQSSHFGRPADFPDSRWSTSASEADLKKAVGIGSKMGGVGKMGGAETRVEVERKVARALAFAAESMGKVEVVLAIVVRLPGVAAAAAEAVTVVLAIVVFRMVGVLHLCPWRSSAVVPQFQFQFQSQIRCFGFGYGYNSAKVVPRDSVPKSASASPSLSPSCPILSFYFVPRASLLLLYLIPGVKMTLRPSVRVCMRIKSRVGVACLRSTVAVAVAALSPCRSCESGAGPRCRTVYGWSFTAWRGVRGSLG